MGLGEERERRIMTGTLYGIGVGPGDPELMTVKAVRILQSVPVIAYPAADDGDSSARQIAAQFLPDEAIEIAIRVPMRPGRMPVEVYDEAAREIATHLAEDRDVAVLCEGDPFFYGSFMYLHDRLAATWPCQVVPGVSSLTACAAATARPLVRRNDTLIVLPATLSDEELSTRLAGNNAAAILKVGRHLPRLRAIVETCGLRDRTYYVEYASRENEQVMPLGERNDSPAPYFSMLLISEGQA
jgi:precorrin-2/cobalt-factor-2 C20-methyltransferase